MSIGAPPLVARAIRTFDLVREADQVAWLRRSVKSTPLPLIRPRVNVTGPGARTIPSDCEYAALSAFTSQAVARNHPDVTFEVQVGLIFANSGFVACGDERLGLAASMKLTPRSRELPSGYDNCFLARIVTVSRSPFT